ncbi:MAG: hypothetical protein JSS34_01990 [Proteobacteria bacterium]|nr:hypothetical protein [Pseudomonadota bacterium]
MFKKIAIISGVLSLVGIETAKSTEKMDYKFIAWADFYKEAWEECKEDGQCTDLDSCKSCIDSKKSQYFKTHPY